MKKSHVQTTRRSLTLGRETLRQLSEAELGQAGGAGVPSVGNYTCAPTQRNTCHDQM